MTKQGRLKRKARRYEANREIRRQKSIAKWRNYYRKLLNSHKHSSYPDEHWNGYDWVEVNRVPLIKNGGKP